MLKTQDLRRNFLNYFKRNGHTVIPSSAVVPHDDPTLLFINAGMNQFKDVFLGSSSRDYSRATTSQKCIRVGGKHNDLENVGHTSRHLTFFEMLGNFSFGNYFKREAIAFAWEVATQVFQLDPERIWPTVYMEDDEAFELWKEHVKEDKIIRFGEKENFWAMGDTGPCGPCSELLYDRGERYGSAKSPLEDVSGERYLEFWNLVFMQYNRSSQGVLQSLPRPSIDTGAGLERIISLKMGVESVFETDVLRSLIAHIETISSRTYDPSDAHLAPAFRVIADHLRCLSFAIADGAQPSNVDRGYVLRKVLRRAVRYGRLLGMEEPFLAKVFPRLLSEMGDDYRELYAAKERICEILTTEEEAFMRTLKRGGNILNQVVSKATQSDKKISGDDAFKLKDTYGLPLDEIVLLAKDADLSVDVERYQTLEQEAKERSRSAQKNVQQIAAENLFTDFVLKNGPTDFIGYSKSQSPAKILALVVDGAFVQAVHAGQSAMLVLDSTPFYAEMGGQVGDTGDISSQQAKFLVTTTIAPYKGVIAHVGTVEAGDFKVGDEALATIDQARRQKIANNHTATHLLHWALHEVLGEHIKQAGSIVDAFRLRFDFSHHKALSQAEICRIEDLVNAKIRTNSPVACYEISYDEAQKRSDVKQFFGEKYGSTVRVVDIDFSKELCGGTHTVNLGHIGLFRIAKESSIAAGVRRIEAVTGAEAESVARESEEALLTLATLLKTQSPKVVERVEKLIEENKALAQELKGAKKGAFEQVMMQLLKQAEQIGPAAFIAAKVDLDGEDLRLCADALSSKVKSSVILLGSTPLEDKCHILVRVSDDLVAKGIKAGDIVKAIAPVIEGSGGGRPNSAQAGGKAPKNILQAFAAAKELISTYSL